jgi:16S rRNA (cytosine967-C5)-methyltransferase
MAVEGIASAYHLSVPPTQGGLVIADAASTAVGNAVAAKPGQRVLDMAAAPGGKTIQLWDQIQPGGELVAVDFHRRRIRSAQRRLAGHEVFPRWVRADGTRAPFVDRSFDVVLVDAPCTGLGTLRRRPEIAMRLESGSPERLAEQQRELLAEAWRVARPGGRVIYSVCTLFAAETIDVVAEYPSHAPEDVPGRIWGKGKLLAPHATGTDGMFIAVIDR